MSTYLLRQIMKFITDSEMEANQLVQNFKHKHNVIAHRIIRKDKKDNSYFIVEIVISVNLEKDPFTTYTIE